MGKKGQMAEGINMMYRLFMVALVAVGVFAVGSLAYNYYIDVRDVEAHVMAWNVVDCLSSQGVFEVKDNFLDGCDFFRSDRVYVGVGVYVGDEMVGRDEFGDSGALWVKDLFGKVGEFSDRAKGVGENVEKIIEYEPGYFEGEYFVLVNGKEGVLKMEVLVNGE